MRFSIFYHSENEVRFTMSSRNENVAISFFPRYALRLHFNLSINAKQIFMCENCPRKQLFLKRTNPDGGILVDNASDLVKPLVRNKWDNVKQALGSPYITVGGFVCADKSPANNNAKKMRSSMQQGVGETSMTFQMLMAFVRVAFPPILILENVKELLIVDVDTSTTSDCVYICSQLTAAGYSLVTYFITRAEQFGSAAVRIRIFFVAIRVPKAIADNSPLLIQVRREMHVMHEGLKTRPGNPLEFLCCLDPGDEDDADEEPAKKKTAKSAKYKEEHMDIFACAELQWPPDLFAHPETITAGMTQRHQEQTYYMHLMYPCKKPEPGSVQFYDANYSLKHNLSWNEATEKALVQNPWKNCSLE